MKNLNQVAFLFLFISLTGILSSCSTKQSANDTDTLKYALKDKFYIGTALNKEQILGDDNAGVRLITKHFNAIVAENCMKSEEIQPVEGQFTFDLADKFVEFGEKNNMYITGHCLVWHSQAPEWFFVDKEGNDVSKDVLIERMRTHILSLAGRYKGKIKGWDVVNECIEDDGSWRKSKFYQIIGEEFVEHAFRFAHEADPDAELYYNDYSMANEGRRNGVIAMVKNLQAKGVKIDGIGMQGHCGLDHPDLAEFEKSIVAFSELGVKVMITELDVSVLPFPRNIQGAEISQNVESSKDLNPYTEGLTDSVSMTLDQRYRDIFKVLYKHHEKISRVTTWGVHDFQSWKNNWPVHGRTDYPLLFDRNYQPKKIVQEIIKGEI